VSSPAIETNEPPNAASQAPVDLASQSPAKAASGRRPFALALIVVGVASLAANLGLFRADAHRLLAAIWPAGVIVIGLGVIWLGDQMWRSEAAPFSLARGQAEAGALWVSAGTADFEIGATSEPANLATGSLPLPKRPKVAVHEQHTTVRLEPLWGLPSLSRSPWCAALASDLPWQIGVSSSTGNLDLDLRELLPAGVRVRSLFGDVELKLPAAGGTDVDIRLVFGDLTIDVPDDLGVKVVLRTGALADVERDERRFIRLGATEIGTPLYAVAARRCTLDVWLGTGHLRLL
jgi:hypothetical protein